MQANRANAVVSADRCQGVGYLRNDLDPTRPLAGLSRTQVEVLRMVALSMSNQQIADEGSARVEAAREFIRVADLPTSP